MADIKGKVMTRRKKCWQCGSIWEPHDEYGYECPMCYEYPKNYFVFLYYQGKKYRITRDREGLILDTYKRASKVLKDIHKDHAKGILNIKNYLHTEIEGLKGKNLLARWIAHKEKANLAPSHLRELRRYVKTYFIPAFGLKVLKELNTGDIEDFHDGLPPHLSPKSRKNIMIALRNFCGWLLHREVIAKLPVFPKITVPEPSINWIDYPTQCAILEKVKECHRPIIWFLFHHPVRIAEARALLVEDINTVTMMAHVRHSFSLNQPSFRKNKKPYFLPLHKDFDAAWLKDKLPGAYVFTNEIGRHYNDKSLDKIWKRACKKANQSISLYNASRHSIASQAVNAGVELSKVSKLLGHSSLSMTERYAKLRVENLREIIDNRGTVVPISEGKKKRSKE